MNKIKKVLGVIVAILIVFLTDGFTEKTIVDKEIADFISRGEYVGTKDNNNFYKVRPKYSYENAQNIYNPDDIYQYIGSTGDIILTSRNPMRYSSSWLVKTVACFFSKNFFVGHGTIVVSDDGAIMAEITAHTISDGAQEADDSGVKLSINNWINDDDGSNYILALRVKENSDERKEQVLKYIYDNLGKKYNYSFLFFRKNRYYCTDLISRAYKTAGINVNYDYLATTGNDMIVSDNTYLIFCRQRVVKNKIEEYNIYYLCEE